ncbi:MAG: hypothetical protein QM625_22750 [Ralstonia sp.]|uniref:Uncharacterized protein n=1 Tax=Ralstonia pickettii TaxID=329 RepID=A0A7X2HRX0_RALPI|nr:hypothetical protein [Ralstonia pickettii]MBX3766566.1 hypothetical protein [Ralstonia pickettii]MBX3777353.1 hypothetical protein [Ralstonia pickettii]MBX3805343.1 hypothetical protein [Ralstonia pickettii]MBX3830091.1 hypothetical protein [Ralstonia pickettii]MBX3848577.1 hypothetical protein [Ralstonia pickettii]
MNRKTIAIVAGVAIAYYLWKHAKAKQASNPAVTTVPDTSDQRMTIQ